MKIRIENAKVWRSGNSLVITLEDGKEKGVTEGMIANGTLNFELSSPENGGGRE